MALVHRSHHAQKGVIGRAHGGHQHVPRLQRPKQGAGNGVGAVDELQADQGVLRTKQAGIDLVQLVPPQVVVTVPCGSGEIRLRHPVLLEGRQDPPAVGLGDGVNPGELRPQPLLRLPREGADPFRYL